MNPHLDRADLELLLAIRERGSLAGAAAAADVVPSVVTKRLAALEARVGFKLFQRTTRRVVPTASPSGGSAWPRPSASAAPGSARCWRSSRPVIRSSTCSCS